MATKSAKKLMREQLNKVLNSICEQKKQTASTSIAERVLKSSIYQNSQRVGIYLSTSEEVDTDAIVRNLLQNGKECFVPRCTKSIMVMEKLHSVNDYETMRLNSWGIKEPLAEESRESSAAKGGLDLVLVPGLGFTVEGKRLGRGKGYYDKFLLEMKLLRSKNSLNFSTIGLAFEEQIIKDLPTNDWDYVLDSVIFE